jgi:hypothetical protein
MSPSSEKPSSEKPSSEKPSPGVPSPAVSSSETPSDSESRPRGEGSAPSPTAARSPWAWPAALVVVVAILAGAGLYVFQSLRSLPGDAVDRGVEVLHELQTLASAFRQGTLEIRFLSYATRAEGRNDLQFATLEQTEIFRRKDESSLLWGRLPLPEVVVEATAPVTYTYYVDLNDTWKFEISGDTVRVLAPPIRHNKPAVDASEIRFETRTTSVFRDEDAAMAALKAGLTEMAERRARENVPLIRELGRVKVEEFVGNWLTRSFGDGEDYHVEVVFADELEGESGEGDRRAGERLRLPEDP